MLRLCRSAGVVLDRSRRWRLIGRSSLLSAPDFVLVELRRLCGSLIDAAVEPVPFLDAARRGVMCSVCDETRLGDRGRPRPFEERVSLQHHALPIQGRVKPKWLVQGLRPATTSRLPASHHVRARTSPMSKWLEVLYLVAAASAQFRNML